MNEGNEPPHIHARKGDRECKFWLLVDAFDIDEAVVVGMSEEMLLLTWGKPNSVDQRKQTQKYYQERWVYGVPRKGAGASYMTVRNGMIHEVLQNHRPRKTEGMGSVTILLLALFGLILGATISSWAGSFQF